MLTLFDLSYVWISARYKYSFYGSTITDSSNKINNTRPIWLRGVSDVYGRIKIMYFCVNINDWSYSYKMHYLNKLRHLWIVFISLSKSYLFYIFTCMVQKQKVWETHSNSFWILNIRIDLVPFNLSKTFILPLLNNVLFSI